jgi:hypothetical protein
VLSAPQRYLALLALALGLTGPVSAQGAAPKDSPFLPAPFQLTGVRLAADGTRVCIYAQKDRRSRWIAVGTTTDGIRAVSYDSDQHRAVIFVDGMSRDLALQRGVASAQAADPVADARSSAAPTAAASVPTSGVSATEASTQRDDRMLVSDLLEISLQQRQAHANAQKAPAAPAAATK